MQWSYSELQNNILRCKDLYNEKGEWKTKLNQGTTDWEVSGRYK